METNEKAIEVLNDLIEINNDRITGYEKAVEEAEDNDTELISVFNKMADQSRRLKNELSTQVTSLGGEVAEGTTGLGKIYRVWMDIKTAFQSDDSQAALDNCEFGEDAAQKAYKEALDEENVAPAIRDLITTQKADLKKSHDSIKAMRDAHKAATS